MEELWPLVVAAIVGIAVGAVVVPLLRGREQGPPEAPLMEDDVVSVLAVLPQAVIVLEPDDEVLRASAAAYSFGLVRHDSLAHPQMRELVAKLRLDGEIRDEEVTLTRSPVDGAGTLRMQVRVAPLKDGRVIVLAEDRTAARRLEEMRRDFVANVSHELKTPVGAISLLAETVADSADEPGTVRYFADRMGKESRRLGHLVKEIIDLSRLQEPDALVDPELVELDGIIAEAIDRVRVAAAERKVDLVHGGARGVVVHGDPWLLTTAVRNLLDNAIRYSPPRSRVSVGVQRRDGLVRVAVVDQGSGIPEQHRERVFERFYRADEDRSRETGGTGLGLSIVKHIAQDHGGRVELWSTVGRGSTFTLVLPEAEIPGGPDGGAPAGPPTAPEPAATPDGASTPEPTTTGDPHR